MDSQITVNLFIILFNQAEDELLILGKEKSGKILQVVISFLQMWIDLSKNWFLYVVHVIWASCVGQKALLSYPLSDMVPLCIYN